LAALPQLAIPPGGLSAQLVWQVAVNDDVVHDPGTPPSRTIVPQQSVPLPHWFAPVVPMQSTGSDEAVQLAAQVSLAVVQQQWSPAGHWEKAPASPGRHMGAVQTPAPVQATVHGAPDVCQAPVALQDWG
jgi:hypothetical protein